MSEVLKTYNLANCELTRLDVNDEHFYYGKTEEGNSEYYLSVTKILDIGAPFPEGLREYLRVTTYEEQKQHLQFTGDRGKKLHEALEFLMSGLTLNLENDYHTPYEKAAIVAFIRMMTFLEPRNFVTERIVANPKLKLAGTLDFKGEVLDWKLMCLLEPTKYLDIDSDGHMQLKEKWLDLPFDHKDKWVEIIIDWKFTGRNTYNHKLQVTGYKQMYNESYPEEKVKRVFTWRFSPRHRFSFDFNESTYRFNSFKRIYDTAIEYLANTAIDKDPFEPPTIIRYPKEVKLFNKKEQQNG